MKLHILWACAALAISACASQVAPLPQVITVETTAVPKGDGPISDVARKALGAAHIAYNVPAKAYVTLDQAGQLPPDIKARAKPILLQAYSALRLADAAAATGDSVGVLFHVGEANRLTEAAKAALPAQK